MPPSAKRTKTRRLIGGAAGVGCGIALFCGFGGFLIIARMFKEDSARLPSDLELARRQGLPVTLDDIEELTPKVPEGADAAPLYRKANLEFKKLPEGQRQRLWAGRNATAKQARAATRAIASFQPTMRILKQAVKLPACSFIDDAAFKSFSHDWFVQRREADIQFDQMCSYIDAEVRTKLVKGDLEGALDDTTTEILMANQAQSMGTVSSLDWRMLADWAALGMLWQGMLERSTDSVWIDRIAHLLNEVRLPDLYRNIQMEFVLGRSAIVNLNSLQDLNLDKNTPEMFNRAADSLYQSPGVKQAFEGQLLKTYLQSFSVLPADRQNWLAIFEAFKKIDKNIQENHGLDNSVTKSLIWFSPSTPLMYGYVQLEQRMLLQAAAALKIRNSAGRFPTALPIGGDTAIDPLWNKPLHYKSDGNSIEIGTPGRDFGKGGPPWMRRRFMFTFPRRRELGRRRSTY